MVLVNFDAAAIERESPVTVIEPESGLAWPDFKEIWEYRDLLYFLVRRDFVVRYKQTLAGLFWSILQPIGLTIVFSVFLGLLAKVPSTHGIPYAVFALSGVSMWTFVSKALDRSADSTVASAEMLSKIYFPRVLIPLSAVLAATVDFLIAIVVVLIALVIYGRTPGPEVLALPAVVLLAVVVTLGFGLWFSALNVRYRDVKHLLAFLLLAGMFVTPVVYPFALVPEYLRPLYALNPMVGVLEFWRWALFGFVTASPIVLAIPVVTGTLAVVTGTLYFRSAERTFADVI
jgi:lipopolysaccharide transport system permease protein